MSEQFFVTLNSDSTCEFRYQNRPSKFRVHLGRVIELSGRWEVALFEIYFPTTLCNVRECQILHEKTSFSAETGEMGFNGYRQSISKKTFFTAANCWKLREEYILRIYN